MSTRLGERYGENVEIDFSDFAFPLSRMETDGKGESMPFSKNDTMPMNAYS
jgi:hypothetical protein